MLKLDGVFMGTGEKRLLVIDAALRGGLLIDVQKTGILPTPPVNFSACGEIARWKKAEALNTHGRESRYD